MGWARIDDGFHDHPKVDELSLSAVGLWTLCLTWAHRHRRSAVVPGHVSDSRVRKLAGKQSDVIAAELVASQLWDVEPNVGGYVIHDFADYLPRERDPAERREAARKGGARKWQRASKPDGKPDGNLPSPSLPTDMATSMATDMATDMATSMATDASRAPVIASAPAFPSRPVVVTSVGGQRTETLPAETPRCAAHSGMIDDPGPCRGCMKAREKTEANAKKAAANAALRRLACPHCDENGMRLDADNRPAGRCDHQATKVER